MTPAYQRGTVWWVELPIKQGSHIQGGTRPCVIVSTGYTTQNSGVITVCPLSTKLDAFPFHPKVYTRDKASQVLCEQIVTIDIAQIGDYVCSLSEPDMAAFERSLYLSLGIGPQKW